MKNLIPFLALILFVFSCTEENPCDTLDCGANGTCNEETAACICDDFYEGDSCELEVRAKFLGEWSGTGVCDYNPSNVFSLDVAITQGVGIDEIRIQSDNILQAFTMSGVLDQDSNISLPEFEAHIGSNLHDGIIEHQSENSLVFTLNAYVNGVKNTCVYTLSK